MRKTPRAEAATQIMSLVQNNALSRNPPPAPLFERGVGGISENHYPKKIFFTKFKYLVGSVGEILKKSNRH
jgi:hypothetical protein